MSTTKDDIRRWLATAKEKGATHLIVACDGFDHGDYPVYVLSAGNVGQEVARISGQSMQRVMEVYALHLDWESQLAEHRSYHLESPPTPGDAKLTLEKRHQAALGRLARKLRPPQTRVARLLGGVVQAYDDAATGAAVRERLPFLNPKIQGVPQGVVDLFMGGALRTLVEMFGGPEATEPLCPSCPSFLVEQWQDAEHGMLCRCLVCGAEWAS